MPRSVGPLYRLQKQRVCYVCDLVSNLMKAKEIAHVTWPHSYANYFCTDISRADTVFIMHRLTTKFATEASVYTAAHFRTESDASCLYQRIHILLDASSCVV